MLNKIIIMGRLTRDPESRRTNSDKRVVNFSIACDRDREFNGERPTDFVDIVAWGSTAEFIERYFSRGSMIVVSGRLQMRNWEDREGNKRVSAEVLAEQVYFGEKKNG